jgi:hypothetical protein
MLTVTEENIRILPLWNLPGEERFVVYTMVQFPLKEGGMKDFYIQYFKHIETALISSEEADLLRALEIKSAIESLNKTLQTAFDSNQVVQGKDKVIFELDPLRYNESVFNFEGTTGTRVEDYKTACKEFAKLQEDVQISFPSTKLRERITNKIKQEFEHQIVITIQDTYVRGAFSSTDEALMQPTLESKRKRLQLMKEVLEKQLYSTTEVLKSAMEQTEEQFQEEMKEIEKYKDFDPTKYLNDDQSISMSESGTEIVDCSTCNGTGCVNGDENSSCIQCGGEGYLIIKEGKK